MKEDAATIAQQKVVNFLFKKSFQETITSKTIIKKLKEKHNALSDRYFEIINKSRISMTHLPFILKEYEFFLNNLNTLVISYKESNNPDMDSLREILVVAEDTIFEMWRYFYKNKYYSKQR